jgi:hypothetical protein
MPSPSRSSGQKRRIKSLKVSRDFVNELLTQDTRIPDAATRRLIGLETEGVLNHVCIALGSVLPLHNARRNAKLRVDGGSGNWH